MTSIDLASNSALLQVAEKLAEQNALLGKVAIRGESAFIRYSAYADGTDFTETWSAGQNYIGHATGLEAPADKEGYTWSLFASNIRETLTVTLKKGDWLNNTQIIETVQLGETGSVFPSPKPESQEAYLEAGIVISAATGNALVFTCLEVPEVDLVVDIQVTEPLAVIGGTGVSSWNELLDKPFNDTRRPGLIELTFDGNLEGKEVITEPANPNIKYVKISNFVPNPLSGIIGKTYKYAYKGEELGSGTFVSNKFQNEIFGAFYETSEENTATLALTIMALPISNNGLSLTPGIWLAYNNGYYFSSIELDGIVGELDKLDKKYVHTPDWHAAPAADGEIKNKPVYDYVAELGDTITREQNTVDINDSLGLACLSHNIPSIEDLKKGYFVVSSTGAPDETYYLKDLLGDSFDEENPNRIIVIGNDQCGLGIALVDGATLSSSPMIAKKAGIYETQENMMYILTGTPKSSWISKLHVPGFNFIRKYHKKLDYSLIETPDWNAVESTTGYIANRPFGNVVVDGNEVLTKNALYDETYTLLNLLDYKRYSKVVLTNEQLAKASLKMRIPDGNNEPIEQEFSGEALEVLTYQDSVAAICPKMNDSQLPFIFVAREDNAKLEGGTGTEVALLAAMGVGSFPKAGVYFLDGGLLSSLIGDFEIVSLTIPGATFEKIEFKPLGAEYISDEIARMDDLRALENTIGYAATDPDKTFAEVIDETFAKKEAVETLEKRLNAVADSDDETLDQLSEIVEFIKNNMDPIEVATAQSDWEQNDSTKIDYIKNKPFGEEGTVITCDIADEDERGIITYNSSDSGSYIKVSDDVLTANQLIGATIFVDGQSTALPESEVASLNDNKFVSAWEMSIVSVRENDMTFTVADIPVEVHFPSVGTYVTEYAINTLGLTKIELAGGTIKTLDEKFIPDTIARKADVVVEWGKF